jgi:hypothetical protein
MCELWESQSETASPLPHHHLSAFVESRVLLIEIIYLEKGYYTPADIHSMGHFWHDSVATTHMMNVRVVSL